MPDRVMINFDRQKLANLKRAYTKAKNEGSEQFKFENHDYLTAYARYLIEYLESALR